MAVPSCLPWVDTALHTSVKTHQTQTTPLSSVHFAVCKLYLKGERKNLNTAITVQIFH